MSFPISYMGVTIADNTKKQNGEPETTSTSLPITTLTPSNVAATETLVGNLLAAFAGVTLGRYIKNETVYARNNTGAPIPAASNLAQRENKWLMRYHDATNYHKFQASIGTADLSLLANNSEFLDLTADPGLAVKTAFEAVIVSPDDPAHSVVLDSMQFVGRNS